MKRFMLLGALLGLLVVTQGSSSSVAAKQAAGVAACPTSCDQPCVDAASCPLPCNGSTCEMKSK